MNDKDNIIVKNERIVLCRPCGGTNDILVQIEKCYRYCRKYKRKLVVDGSASGFLDDLAKYFIPRDNIIFFGKIDFLTPPFDVFPKFLQNDLYYNEEYFNHNTSKCVTTKDGIPVTFDFKKDYKEQILVHLQYGGGKTGIIALARLDLKEDIKIHIKKIIEDLKNQAGYKGKYDAVHIRNTGYKTDYKSYFNDLRNKLNKTTFLCTDDYECQQYAKMFFGEKLKPVSDIPDLSSCPVKSLVKNKHIDRYKTNIDALTDLFILACADKIYYALISSGEIKPQREFEEEPDRIYFRNGMKSGFLVLAENLHDNKRIINNTLYKNKVSLLSYHLALYQIPLRFALDIILRIFRKLYSLLHNRGIPYTVRYIFCRLSKKELPN